MALAEAIDTTRIPRVAGRTGRHTAVVTPQPCRVPPQTISNVGLIGGGHCLLQREV
jgi:predicted ATPase with chaperone activity